MPAIGSLAIVNDDGTGDTSATYFWDGDFWRKNSSPYTNQGSVFDGIPSDPSQRVVAAPDATLTPVSSEIQPPVSGPSKGYGIYAGLAGQIISASTIYVFLTLTEEGLDNLGVIVNLFRRIKPTVNRLFLFYVVEGSYDPPVQLEVFDVGAIF